MRLRDVLRYDIYTANVQPESCSANIKLNYIVLY